MKWSIEGIRGSRRRLLRNGTSLFRGHEMAIIESYRFNSGQFRKSESSSIASSRLGTKYSSTSVFGAIWLEALFGSLSPHPFPRVGGGVEGF